MVLDGELQTFINDNVISIDIGSTDVMIVCITGSESVELRSLGGSQTGLMTPNNSSIILENLRSSSRYEFLCTDPFHPLSGNSTLRIETVGELVVLVGSKFIITEFISI